MPFQGGCLCDPMGPTPVTWHAFHVQWMLKQVRCMLGVGALHPVSSTVSESHRQAAPGPVQLPAGPTMKLSAKQPRPQSRLPRSAPLNGPRQGLNEEQRKPGPRPRNYKRGLGTIASALQTPVHLIMIISVFFLHRQRRLLMRNTGAQQLPH